MKQFSLNFFYIKEVNLTILFDSLWERVVTLRSKFDEDQVMLSHSFENFNNKFKNFQCISEIIFNLVMGALSESVEILKFWTIPLSENEFNIIFQRFKNEYEEKINITNLKLNYRGAISHLTIKIINPKNTHFIQQAYLRNFSSNKEEWAEKRNKDRARLFVYNKKNLKIQKIGNSEIEQKKGVKNQGCSQKGVFLSKKESL